MSLQYELYTVKQIRAIEAEAIHGVSETTLMARAGRDAFSLLMEHYSEFATITVLCGAGNNGGDGFVLARHAKEAGLLVTVLTVGDMTTLSDTAKYAYEAMEKEGVKPRPFCETDTLDESDVVVDALLGIGVSGEVRGPYCDAINQINGSHSFVLSLDLPSGISADTGEVLGCAVYASMTVTFIGIKQGLLTGDAVDYTGSIYLSTLELEKEIEAEPISALRLDDEAILSFMPVRPKGAHKGSLGHVLIVAGDIGMAGAARLCGEAALRIGAGAVTVATHAEHMPVILCGRPELMCVPIVSKEALRPLLDKVDVCVVGPGLNDTTWSTDVIKQALEFKGPKVIDAGALRFLAGLKKKVADTIITPHPGEAAMLLSTTSKNIQADRFQAVIALVKGFADVVVLKGAGTVVQSLNEIPEVCNLGNPGMATAGMGDVLAGMIGGLCAQGATNEEAAKLGVVLHAISADKAVSAIGEHSLLASDLFSYFSSCIKTDDVMYDWVSEDEI